MNSQGSTVEKNTHAKRVKCEEFCLQTRLGGEIWSSDVIMHEGHWILDYSSAEGAVTRRKSIQDNMTRPMATPWYLVNKLIVIHFKQISMVDDTAGGGRIVPLSI